MNMLFGMYQVNCKRNKVERPALGARGAVLRVGDDEGFGCCFFIFECTWGSTCRPIKYCRISRIILVASTHDSRSDITIAARKLHKRASTEYG